MSQMVIAIDNSPTVRKILEVCLHRAGYEDVRTFPDGGTFLRWLRTPEARIPDVVVVDLNLPEIDGYTLIRTLKGRSAFADTAFVILTGRDGMVDRLKGRLSGAKVYLTKPFRTQDIVAVVEALVGSALFPAPSLVKAFYERA